MTAPLDVPHFQQSADGYCLPACVRMVLAFWHLTKTEKEIRRVLGTRVFGTPSFAVKRLSQWDVHVQYREWSIAQLLEALKTGHPVIAFVRTAYLDYWQQDVAHAVVLVGYEENQRYWLHDPALPDGPTSVLWQGLLAAWAEFGYRGARLRYRESK